MLRRHVILEVGELGREGHINVSDVPHIDVATCQVVPDGIVQVSHSQGGLSSIGSEEVDILRIH